LAAAATHLAGVCDALAAHDRTIAAGWPANRRDPQGAAFTASQLVIGSHS